MSEIEGSGKLQDGPSGGETPKSSKISTSTPKKPLSSPQKPPIKNGLTSPTKTKIPPIKAPVGQTPSPNMKNVTSKIGSLENVKHKPGGGRDKKVVTQKLEWSATSKVGSLEKASHRPGGGAKKIQSQKLEWKAESKVGSKTNLKHSPGGGKVKTQKGASPTSRTIENRKMEWKATSKVGSLDNIEHKPGGGDVKIKSEKLNFREKSSPRIGSISERGSRVGSETQSPVPSVSPPASEPATEIHFTEAPPVEKEASPPQENQDNTESVFQPTSPTPEKDSNETVPSPDVKPTPEEETPARTANVIESPIADTAPSMDESNKHEDASQSY